MVFGCTNCLGGFLLLGELLYRYFQDVNFLKGRTSSFLFSVNRIVLCIYSKYLARLLFAIEEPRWVDE